MFWLLVTGGEVTPSETDARSDHEMFLNCNQFLSLQLSVEENFTHLIHTLRRFCFRGDSRPGQNNDEIFYFPFNLAQ